MRSRWVILGLVLALAGCRAEARAESVRIEKKTEVFTEAGKQATVHTPVFHGIRDPAVLRTLQESIAAGVREATGASPEEWKADSGGWLYEIDYQVTFNRHDLLSLVYSISGSGAYPSTQTACVVADLRTGRRLTAKDLFKPAALPELAARVDRLRSAAVEKALREHRARLKEYEMTEEDLAAILEPAVQSRFGAESLDTFRLDDKGVTFVYEFDFPHVSEALEPSGEYFLSYEELRPYVNPEGPLARLIG